MIDRLQALVDVFIEMVCTIQVSPRGGFKRDMVPFILPWLTANKLLSVVFWLSPR